jgi:hypothetical protein
LATARRFRRRQAWLIELAHSLRLEDETGQRRKTRQVKQEVQAVLEHLEQEAADYPDEQRHAHHIVQTIRQRWWGLFTCYRVPGLPATNNDQETFFNQLKHHQRRINGRKSVHAFMVRYGAYVAYLDPRETFEQLLARLAQVSDEDFQVVRQAWRENQAPLHKAFRFQHDRARFLKELEREWANIPRRRSAHR